MDDLDRWLLGHETRSIEIHHNTATHTWSVTLHEGNKSFTYNKSPDSDLGWAIYHTMSQVLRGGSGEWITNE